MSLTSPQKLYLADRQLAQQLGLSSDPTLPHAEEVSLGDAKTKRGHCRVFVSSHPAMFFRFEITTAEGKKGNIKTGSGTLAQYWPFVEMVLEGMLWTHDIVDDPIEPFIITSSRKTVEGYWRWSRADHKTAHGLAQNVLRSFEDEAPNVTITVLDVANGLATRY